MRGFPSGWWGHRRTGGLANSGVKLRRHVWSIRVAVTAAERDKVQPPDDHGRLWPPGACCQCRGPALSAAMAVTCGPASVEIHDRIRTTKPLLSRGFLRTVKASSELPRLGSSCLSCPRPLAPPWPHRASPGANREGCWWPPRLLLPLPLRRSCQFWLVAARPASGELDC